VSRSGFRDYKNYGCELKLNAHLHDINPVICGEAAPPPEKISKTPPSAYYLLHYVQEGKGTYICRGERHCLCAGQAFLVMPGDVSFNQPDKDDPWIISWVGFKGVLAPHFRRLPPVFDPGENIFPHLKNLRNPSPNLEIELAIDLMTLYTKMILPNDSKLERTPSHVQRVIDFVSNHYMLDLTIQDIADHVGLSHDYLSKIFKNQIGTSIQTHLLEVRIMEAKRFLSLGRTVDETRTLCGFNSSAHFSRQFKRCTGQSPRQWVKHLKSFQGMA